MIDPESNALRSAEKLDLEQFAAANCEADYQLLREAFPRLTASADFLAEAKEGNLASYEAASCVMDAAFELGNILKGEGVFEAFEAKYFEWAKAYRILSSKDNGSEIALRLAKPFHFHGNPDEVLEPITYEVILGGEDMVGDCMPEEGFDAVQNNKVNNHVFFNAVLRMRLPECSYAKDIVDEAVRGGRFNKIYTEFDVDGTEAYCFQFVIDSLDGESPRGVIMYALDCLINLHMNGIKTYSFNGGQEARKAESAIASLWWCLMNTLRVGRLGRCAVCGKPFIAVKERGNKRRYCGDACKEYAHKNPGKTRKPRKTKTKAADNASKEASE